MDTQQKENFCASCITVPLALVGGGMSVYGTTSDSKGKNKRLKKILLVSGIITILFAVYFYTRKNCGKDSCKI